MKTYERRIRDLELRIADLEHGLEKGSLKPKYTDKVFAKMGLAYLLEFTSEQIRKGSSHPSIDSLVKDAFEKDLNKLTPDERHEVADRIHKAGVKVLDEAIAIIQKK